MERPLYLRNLYNVSLEPATPHSDIQPLILAELVCNTFNFLFNLNESKYFLDSSDCSAIFILDSINIIIKGVKVQSNVDWKFDLVTVDYLQLVAGEISFYNVSNVVVQDVTATRGLFVNRGHNFTTTDCTFGHINNFKPLCTQSYNLSSGLDYGLYTQLLHPTDDINYGLFFRLADNIAINNITVLNVIVAGIYLLETHHAHISDATSLYVRDGTSLHLDHTWNTRVSSPTLEKCDGAMHTLFLERAIYSTVTGLEDSTSNAQIFLIDSIDVTFAVLNMSFNKQTVGLMIETCTNVTFQNSTFINNLHPKRIFTDVINLPKVVYIHYSVGVEFHNCAFVQNQKSCIHSEASEFTLSGKVEFYENTAPSGTAIILAKKSNMTLTENCDAVFVNNRAVSTGGAIHIVTGEDVDDARFWCFLNILGSRERPRLTFRGNTAGKGGDVLYGGHLAVGFNGVYENCLQNFYAISNISQNSLSVVASEPSRICLCNSSGVPDCLKFVDSKRHEIYPGQTINASVVTVGQAFGSVVDSVFAQFIPLPTSDAFPHLYNWQYTQVAGKDSCNILNYTLFHPHNGSVVTDAVLALTPQFKEVSYFVSNESDEVKETLERYDMWVHYKVHGFVPFPKKILEFPVYVNVTLLPCPLGFQLRGSPAKCECNTLLQNLTGVECDITDQVIVRRGLVWIGVEKNSNETLLTSEYCPLNYCKSQKVTIGLGDYDTQCNYDHSGTLCGQCRLGLSLALGSSQCLSCSNWYLVLTVPFAMAGLGLVAFIKLFDLTTSHGTISGFIFYANIVKANEFIFLPQSETNLLTVFIAWTNLDLGIETCFWNGLSAYSKTWLQFVFPVYIWAIAGGIIMLSKHSNRVAKIMGNNSVSVLATLFFLSYSKLLRTIIVGLSYTVIESSEGHKVVWSADGNLEYLGPYHAPLFTVCIAVLLFLWLPYTLLLFCGQWLYKCNCRPIAQLLAKYKPFLDAYYGPLKGEHRYWFGAQLLVRAIILLISSTVPANRSGTVVFSISVSAVVLASISSLGFYHNKMVSYFELSFFTNLALLGLSAFFTSSTGGSPTIASYVLIGVVFVQFVGLIFYKVSVIFRARQAVLPCSWLNKDQRLVEEDDDWELYEQAALVREREAHDFQDERYSMESNESLLTY